MESILSVEDDQRLIDCTLFEEHIVQKFCLQICRVTSLVSTVLSLGKPGVSGVRGRSVVESDFDRGSFLNSLTS